MTRASKLRWNEPVYFFFPYSFTFYWAANISGWTLFSGISKFSDKKKGKCGLVSWLAMLSEAFHIYVFQLKMASVLFLDPLSSLIFLSLFAYPGSSSSLSNLLCPFLFGSASPFLLASLGCVGCVYLPSSTTWFRVTIGTRLLLTFQFSRSSTLILLLHEL